MRTAAAVLVLCSGCSVSNYKADTFAFKDAHFPRDLGRGILLYIPNRLVDLLDIVHVGLGLSLGPNVEIHPTRYARLGVTATAGAGLAWLGRFTRPTEAAAYIRAAAGQAEAIDIAGERWRIPQWDIGMRLGTAYVGIAPDEFVDFLVGFSSFDLKLDDY